ncbi:MAG: peptidase [Nocardioides sp.]|nr:peptidase [Nocardioides sp.]
MSSLDGSRIVDAVLAHGLDAVVCASPENVAYAAGFVVPSQSLMRWRHAAVVVTAAGDEAMVCVDMEESTVRAARPDAELRTWAEFTGDAMATLATLLTDLGLERGRIGVELSYLAAADFARLQAALPGAIFCAADSLLTQARQIKSATEIELLARLSRISDTAIGDALRSVRAGDTEMDIAAALTRSVYEQGATSFKLMIVATGPRSQLPNVGPSDRRLIAGDVCRVEIFSVIDGYHAGVCRTAVVGPSPRGADEVYRRLVDCRDLVMELVRPGMPAREIYARYRTRLEELNLPAISFVGHGIGVNLHEQPYLGPHSDTLLEPGMVLGVEPLVYRTEYGFGMQIKDMVRVTADGVELLSDVNSTDQPIAVPA